MTLVRNVAKPTPATQSDLAFQGRSAYAGTYDGLRVTDISDPANATQVAFERCPGSQFDVSVWGDLLFVSVDAPRTNDSCSSAGTTASNPNAWEGVRIFDISDPLDPHQIKAVRTDCGSHTHTLLPPGNNGGSLFIYVSSYGLTPANIGPNCEQFHGKISVIHVPLEQPTKARVVAEPEVDVPVFDASRLELDVPAGSLLDTSGCHDITVLKPRRLAAAACTSIGQLWNISDSTDPRPIRDFTTPQVKAWHSSSFTWDGRRVAFGDEAGGGVIGRCRAQDYPDTAIWFYDVATGAQLGRYKIPRFFPQEDHCTMHNYNFVPGVDRDILVSAAYHGGTTVADVTDPANPVEPGFYEANSPVGGSGPNVHAGTWSSYWHNGFIYGNDINRGLDGFSIAHPAVAGTATLDRNNPQTQERLFP